MKKKQIFACICATFCLLSASACSFGNATALQKPPKTENLKYEEHYKEDFMAFKQNVDAFSSQLSESVYKTKTQTENFTVSPVSVFMALSLAAECAEGDTKTEILNALGVDYDALKTHTATLYRSLSQSYTADGVFGKKTTGQLKLSNSVWLDKSAEVKQERLDVLASDYFCYSYEADFFNDNQAANLAVQDFVKEQTKGKINRDFDLSEETLFALINTLYLKDVWTYDGDELQLTNDTYNFTAADGSITPKKLLMSNYRLGRAYETENYSYFLTSTYHGYLIKLIVPKDGYAVSDVFTAETLNEVQSVRDFDAEDEENLIRYHTRCLFPEYKASYNDDIKTILQENFGVLSLFDQKTCNLNGLLNQNGLITENAYCPKLIHTTKLEVNRKGIEGAAVTVVPGAGAPGPDAYKNVYVDFIVDRAFAFIITDSHDVALFSGVVETI